MLVAATLSLIASWLPQAVQDPHPADKDKTGIRWVHPFGKAVARARAETRPLLILPLGGGSDAKGNW